ncbi:MAG: FtsQ-type POTRA domain-containing protein [Verrucomicrobiota bacterium]
MRRQTRKSSHSSHRNVLHVRVWSPRLFCFGFFKFLLRLTLVASVVAIIGGIGWGIHLGIQRAFYDNADFTLQEVDLNPNQAIDEMDFVKLTGLNLRVNLFRIDLKAITKCLASVPQIADAHVERRLPGTLVVRVTARTPRAWIACPDAGLPAERKVGAMLVDSHDCAYPCAERQFEAASKLPIVVVPARKNETIASGEKIRQPELHRCLRLLASTGESDPEALCWIGTIQQANPWSLSLTTRGGTIATFGLRDHARQVSNLRAALNHAERKGYSIATINLIPRENVPVTVTVKGGDAPPKAILVAEPVAQEVRQVRHSRDSKPVSTRD